MLGTSAPKQPAERRTVIRQGPDHLIVSLSRFAYSSSGGSKMCAPVLFSNKLVLPVEFDGSRADVHGAMGDQKKDFLGPPASSLKRPLSAVENVEYSLYGVVVHAGRTASAGHYYAYAADSDMCLRDDVAWHLYNDSSVTPTTAGVVAGLGQATKETVDTPYLLFYRKCTPSTQSRPKGASVAEMTPGMTLNDDLRDFLVQDNSAVRRGDRAGARLKPGQGTAFAPRPPPGPGGGGCGGGGFSGSGGGSPGGGFSGAGGGGGWGVC